jgi:hypothetical protein
MVICHINPLDASYELRLWFCLGRSPVGLMGRRTEAKLLELVQTLETLETLEPLALEQTLEQTQARAQRKMTQEVLYLSS